MMPVIRAISRIQLNLSRTGPRPWGPMVLVRCFVLVLQVRRGFRTASHYCASLAHATLQVRCSHLIEGSTSGMTSRNSVFADTVLLPLPSVPSPEAMEY